MSVAATVSEAELQEAVIGMAKYLGWHIAHQRPARRKDGSWRTAIEGHKGFPDLVLLRPPRLIFAELKSKRGDLSLDQSVWLNGLKEVAGVQTFVWKPIDWETGTIEAVLR